jgi:hypothetical protein
VSGEEIAEKCSARNYLISALGTLAAQNYFVF